MSLQPFTIRVVLTRHILNLLQHAQYYYYFFNKSLHNIYLLLDQQGLSYLMAHFLP